MKKQFVGVLLLLLSFNVIAQTAKDAYRNKYLEKYKASTTIYKALIVSDSKNAILYKYQIGDNYIKSSKLDSAKFYFTEIVNSDDKNTALGYVGLGKLTLAANPTEGHANFNKALEISKQSDALVLAEIAEAYTQVNDWASAKPLIEKALKLDATNARYMVIYGDVLRIQAASQGTSGDISLATTQYNNANNADPTYALPYVRLGRLYAGAQTYGPAEQKFNEGIEMDPKYGPLYREQADMNFIRARYQKGFEFYQKYMLLADTTSDMLYKYALYQVYLAKYNEALPILEGLKKENYPNPALYRLLAYCYFETGNVAASDVSLQKFMNGDPKPALIARDYEYSGKILYKNGKDSLGTIALLKAIEMDSNRYELYSNIGDQYYSAKKYDAAIKYYELKLAKSKRPNAQDLLSLGKSYYFLGDYVKADTVFAQVIALRPEIPHGYNWRARVAEKNDPTQEKGLAKPYYEKFIEVASPEASRYKTDLINAYDYMASYYYFRAKDTPKAKEYWSKMLELDPNNKRALTGLKL